MKFILQVDLTSEEADATLAMWEDQLKRLRKITSVRSLNKEIQAAQSVSAVRIRAYKNGDSIRKEPVLIIGSTLDSVREVLDLNLSPFYLIFIFFCIYFFTFW